MVTIRVSNEVTKTLSGEVYLITERCECNLKTVLTECSRNDLFLDELKRVSFRNSLDNNFTSVKVFRYPMQIATVILSRIQKIMCAERLTRYLHDYLEVG